MRRIRCAVMPFLLVAALASLAATQVLAADRAELERDAHTALQNLYAKNQAAPNSPNSIRRFAPSRARSSS